MFLHKTAEFHLLSLGLSNVVVIPQTNYIPQLTNKDSAWLDQQWTGENGLLPATMKGKKSPPSPPEICALTTDLKTPRQTLDLFLDQLGQQAEDIPPFPSAFPSSTGIFKAPTKLLVKEHGGLTPLEQDLLGVCCHRSSAVEFVLLRPEGGLVVILVLSPLKSHIPWCKWNTILCLSSVFHPFPSHRMKAWHIQLH